MGKYPTRSVNTVYKLPLQTCILTVNMASPGTCTTRLHWPHQWRWSALHSPSSVGPRRASAALWAVPRALFWALLCGIACWTPSLLRSRGLRLRGWLTNGFHFKWVLTGDLIMKKWKLIMFHILAHITDQYATGPLSLPRFIVFIVSPFVLCAIGFFVAWGRRKCCLWFYFLL